MNRINIVLGDTKTYQGHVTGLNSYRDLLLATMNKKDLAVIKQRNLKPIRTLNNFAMNRSSHLIARNRNTFLMSYQQHREVLKFDPKKKRLLDKLSRLESDDFMYAKNLQPLLMIDRQHLVLMNIGGQNSIIFFYLLNVFTNEIIHSTPMLVTALEKISGNFDDLIFLSIMKNQISELKKD